MGNDLVRLFPKLEGASFPALFARKPALGAAARGDRSGDRCVVTGIARYRRLNVSNAAIQIDQPAGANAGAGAANGSPRRSMAGNACARGFSSVAR
jgi:hypothetical protein